MFFFLSVFSQLAPIKFTKKNDLFIIPVMYSTTTDRPGSQRRSRLSSLEGKNKTSLYVVARHKKIFCHILSEIWENIDVSDLNKIVNNVCNMEKSLQ